MSAVTDCVVDFLVGEDGLDVVQVFEDVVEFEQRLGDLGVGHGDGARGDVADFCAFGFDTGGFERVEDFVEGVQVATDFVAFVADDDVVGSGFERDFHELVFAGGLVFGDEELTGVEELKGDGAALGEVAAELGEGGADFLRTAGFVVGRDLNDEGDAARAIAFVGEFFEDDAGEFACAFLNGAIDVVGRHVGVARFEEQGAQAGVGVGVAAAGLGGQRDVAREAREDFAFARVGDGFDAFDL